IVDDNLTNRRILEQTLLAWKMKPASVDGGTRALEAIDRSDQSEEPFRLILLDAQMPLMDGFEVAELINKNPRPFHPIIVMLTSAGVRGDALRCREVGISAYLNKPINRADLLEAIKLALGSRTHAEEKSTLITQHSLTEKRRRLRLLLVEDNPVN